MLHLKSKNNNSMEDQFILQSREITNKFLRDIVFIDERAYSPLQPNGERQEVHVNDFDASTVSASFCKQGKICAIYAPQKDTDIDSCIDAIKKADAVVLDWNLQLEPTEVYNPLDDDENDERGKYTLKIINQILEDAGDSKIKLIIVYTGEPNLHDINDQIANKFAKDNIEKDNRDISCNKKNIRIVVRAKDTAQFNHVVQYRDKIVKYEKLPEEIVNEFTQLTVGLLSNYALSAISVIRDNTSNILGVFSPEIDAAFLGHYVSIDNSDDAILMLSELLGSAMSDLIKAEKLDVQSWIKLWIDHFASDHRNIQFAGKNIEVNADALKNIAGITNGELYKKLNAARYEASANKEEKYKKDATKLFSTIEDTDTPNYLLAKLIQHKDIFSSKQTTHKLSTGTIVKIGQNDIYKYLLCIQQRCDSVRLNEGEQRNFLFLPLKEGNVGEAVVIDAHKHLILNKKSYALESYTFSATENETSVITQERDGKNVFIDVDNKLFEWVAELKDLFAQHLVALYTAELSRVGIDNSEWIRLIGK